MSDFEDRTLSDPTGPRNATDSPVLIVNETSFSAFTLPYVLLKSLSSSMSVAPPRMSPTNQAMRTIIPTNSLIVDGTWSSLWASVLRTDTHYGTLNANQSFTRGAKYGQKGT